MGEVRWHLQGHTAGKWLSGNSETCFPAWLELAVPRQPAQLLPRQKPQAHSCAHPHCGIRFLAKPLCFWHWCRPPGRCHHGCLGPRPPPACLIFTRGETRTTVTAGVTPAAWRLLEVSRLLHLLWSRSRVGSSQWELVTGRFSVPLLPLNPAPEQMPSPDVPAAFLGTNGCGGWGLLNKMGLPFPEKPNASQHPGECWQPPAAVPAGWSLSCFGASGLAQAFS